MATTARPTAPADAVPADAPPVISHRAMVTVFTIGATLLQSLDQTIANVALPYMQGSFSASFDEITWVLTSYITAAAIMTAPVGWLATQFGRKPLFVGCIIGFTIASMLCGAAQTLGQIVAFRLLQGMFSAALVPLAQATLLDIYPAERQGFAMAIWGMGVMIGPIMGPTLGGFLTEHYDWRWVFYINLPFGVMAAAGLAAFLPGVQGVNRLRFDWFGFTVLSVGIGSLQIMLDRGQDLDWFYSHEIIIEALLAGLGIYLFIIHLLSGRQPLIRPTLFRDRNFATGLVLMFAVGTLLVSSLALMTPWLQVLSDYPVETAGLVMAPRGLGNLATIMLCGRLSNSDRSAPFGRCRTDADLRVVLYHDGLDPGCVAARHHRDDHAAGCRHGAGIHALAGAGIRHPARGTADRGGVVVQSAAKYWCGDRCFRDVHCSGAEYTSAARGDRRQRDPLQPRACRSRRI